MNTNRGSDNLSDKVSDKAVVERWAYERFQFGKGLFFVLDTETTGLGAEDEICEIAVMDQNGNVVFESLVKPKGEINPFATQVHGITNEMVANAPPFDMLWQPLRALLLERPVLIYNVEFDLRMLNQSVRIATGAVRYEVGWQDYDIDCVMVQYARWYGKWNRRYGNFTWRALTDAVKDLGLVIDAQEHRAAGDCGMTLSVVSELARRYVLRLENTVPPLPKDLAY